jgi:hypothetical protein
MARTVARAMPHSRAMALILWPLAFKESFTRNFLYAIFVMQATKDRCHYDSAIFRNAVPLGLQVCLG